MGFEAENISFRYGKHRVLDRISFQLENGQILALLGSNGIGKTTLLKAVSGILRPYEGKSRMDGKELLEMSYSEKAKVVAYVPQNTNSTFPIRVIDAVLMGRKPFVKFALTKRDEELAFSILERLELSSHAFQYINELSGGERQRVFIARALCQEPSLLLLDEPTSSMDLKNQLRTMEMVKRLAKENNLTVMVSIHDINLAAMYCDRFLLLRQKQIYAIGSAEEILTEENIHQIYDVRTKIEVVDDCRHMILRKPEKK